MNGTRIIGIVLLACGALGLAVGRFSYTRDTTALTLGPMSLSLKEHKTVEIPVWGSGAALVIGGVLLVVGGRRK